MRFLLDFCYQTPTCHYVVKTSIARRRLVRLRDHFGSKQLDVCRYIHDTLPYIIVMPTIL
jgi:hypothetical protein